tara:strand:- start:691 stop:885 length:195 start_codon:yes stop_codon:yes gene_type:complete
MNKIVLPANKYLQAKKDVRITARANKEYKDKLHELSEKFDLSEGVILSYMIDYFYVELIQRKKK